MDTNAMHETLQASEAGKLRFPEVIHALVGAGVESYCSDFLTGNDTFYMPGGETHVEKMKLPEGAAAAVPPEFSKEGIVAAIRAAQRDEIRYPEFLKRAIAAGTAGYRVFLSGRRVVYFGRTGELHIEEFPGAKS